MEMQQVPQTIQTLVVITQAVSCKGDSSFEIRISAQEESIKSIDFSNHFIHNCLAVCRAIVEEYVQ